MALAESLARLYGLAKRGARRSLDPIREACALEGDPQDRVPSVHVGGTNGKGSVAASVEAIARAAGLRTGLYTSPHLQRFAERIRIDGAPVSDELLDEQLTIVLDRHPSLTFFEVATLASFRILADARLDLVVLEVGLGGRLDATNVVTRPRVTAITSIARDHTEWLGDTLESIAAEKAGILKPGVPLVTGRLPESAAEVIARRAREIGASPIVRVGQEITHTMRGTDLVVEGMDHMVIARPALAGAHQRDNASVAAGIAWLLARPEAGAPPLAIDDRAVAIGIGSVRWPGRLEELVALEGPYAGRYLLDGAHNEEGARALAAELDGRPGRKTLIFGAMSDKAWPTMLRELAPRCAHRIYVAPSASGAGRSAASPDALLATDTSKDSPTAHAAGSVEEALAAARGVGDLVVVAGSLYLVGEVRALLRSERRDPQVGL